MRDTISVLRTWLQNLGVARRCSQRLLRRGILTLESAIRMNLGGRPPGFHLDKSPFLVVKIREIIRTLLLFVFTMPLCLGLSLYSMADAPKPHDSKVALEELVNSRKHEDVLPEVLRLCFDPNASESGALEECMMLWIPLSKRSSPNMEMKTTFHVLTRSCSKSGDDMYWRPCFTGGSIPQAELEALGIWQEFSVEKFRKGCKEEGYLGVKAAMSCLRVTGEAQSIGFGVSADEYRASGYYTLACRTGFGQVCFIVKLDAVDAQNKWVEHAVVEDDQEKKHEPSKPGLVLSDSELQRNCEIEESPDANACFWAGYAYRAKAIFLTSDEEKRADNLALSRRVFERGCGLGSLESCNELQRLKR